MCSAQGGYWLLRHSVLLSMRNTGMTSAEQGSMAGMRHQRAGLQEPAEGEVGSLQASGDGAWAAFARNQYKDCFEVEEEGQKMD